MGSNSNSPQQPITKGPDNTCSYRCIIVGCFIFLWMVSSAQAAPTTRTTETTPRCLSVTSCNCTKGLSAKTWDLTLKECFRKFSGLNVTDRPFDDDAETKPFVALPQCAEPGKSIANPTVRSKRYVLTYTWLNKTQLTYRIHNYPRSLSKSIVECEIARAFDMWSKASNFTFTPIKNGSADINIRFLWGDHGHEASFDGKGGTLGHAYLPGHKYQGTLHFDAAEYWTSRTKAGTNLFQVAVHEIGHILGLDHSDVPGAVMWPDYRKYNPKFRLHEDDIRGWLPLAKLGPIVVVVTAVVKCGSRDKDGLRAKFIR